MLDMYQSIADDAVCIASAAASSAAASAASAVASAAAYAVSSATTFSSSEQHSSSTKMVDYQLDILSKYIRAGAKNIVVFTGAGISASAGVQTLLGEGGIFATGSLDTSLPEKQPDFNILKPTVAHAAITEIVNSGLVNFVVTINTDDLHAKSGLPLDRLAEVYGNRFVEQCVACGAKYKRAHDVAKIAEDVCGGSFMARISGGPCYTGSTCVSCGGKLKMFVFHYGKNLPEDQCELAKFHASIADLAIVCGSSCTEEFVSEVPLMAKRVVIFNIEKTELSCHDKVWMTVLGKLDETLPALRNKVFS